MVARRLPLAPIPHPILTAILPVERKERVAIQRAQAESPPNEF